MQHEEALTPPISCFFMSLYEYVAVYSFSFKNNKNVEQKCKLK